MLSLRWALVHIDYHKMLPRWPLDNQDAFGIYSWLDLDVSRLSQDYSKMTSWSSRCFWHLFMIRSWCVRIITRLFQDDLLSIKMLLAFIHEDILMCQDYPKIISWGPLEHVDVFGIYSWWDLDVSRLSQDYSKITSW